MATELELQLRYDSIPLSKRLAMVGTAAMTKNSVQTEQNWGGEINFVDAETGFTPLMAAALGGSAASVTTIIDRGADVNFQDPKKGRTALILACKNGKTEAVEALLHRGASLTYVDKGQMTPLMWCCKNGHFGCVKACLARGAGINTFDRHEWTALHFAAKHGHKDIVEFLASSGAALSLKECLEEGKTPLMLAAQYGRKDTVHVLLDKGSSINLGTTTDELTPLMLAAKEGHKGTVTALLERGADPNISDSYGWTALHFAASWGRKATAAILLTHGADVNSMPRKKLSGGGGTTPLIVAIKGQQIEVIKVLLEHGADTNLNDAMSGRNALAIAAMEGLYNVVMALIDFQLDLDIRDARGMTPLMLSVCGGHAETIRILLAACADINILDLDYKTALDHATDYGRRDVYLMAILRSSPACKANIISWLEMDTPKMIRGSVCGGPSVFLNNILYHRDGLFSGLMQRPPDKDITLVHNLIMLTAACSRSALAHPADGPDLYAKIDELDEMLLSCFDARAFCIDQNVCLALTLQSFPEAITGEGQFDYRYFATAFVSGPLALYLENGLSKFLTAYQISRVIDDVFTTCMRGPGELGESGYGGRSMLLRLRYCPAFLFIGEGMSKLLTLIFVVVISQQAHSGGGGELQQQNTYFSSMSDSTLTQNENSLIVLVILSVLYELGTLEEKAWATSPSISFDPNELNRRRKWSVRLYFFRDVWKFLDLVYLCLLIVWLLLKLKSLRDVVQQGAGFALLSLSAIPICLGLLRYISAFHRQFGKLVLSAFIVTKNLFGFLVLFAATGAGFGIAFLGLFGDIHDFSSPSTVFRALFDAIYGNYDLSVFDEANNYHSLGITVFIVFIIWTVIVLLNMIVAHITATYVQANDAANKLWLLVKAQHIQQFILVQEKSPLCMLPAPLNIIPVALYPFHVFNTWRARLYPSNKTSLSFAGTSVDWLLKILFLVPAAFLEHILYVWSCTPRQRGSMFHVIVSFFPGVFHALSALVTKILYSDPWFARVLVKSRLSDGRLRVYYGDSRDNNETIGVQDKHIFADSRLKMGDQVGGSLDDENDGEIFLGEKPGTSNSNKRPSSQGLAATGGSFYDSKKIFASTEGGAATSGLGDSSMLWKVGIGDLLARNSIDDEGKDSDAGSGAGGLGTFGLGTLTRADSSVSLLSDISSGEMMERHPPPKPLNNDFLPNIQDGLFQPHERREIFESVLPDVFRDDESMANISAEMSTGAVLNALNSNVSSRLAEIESRSDRLFVHLKEVISMLDKSREVQEVQTHQIAAISAKI